MTNATPLEATVLEEIPWEHLALLAKVQGALKASGYAEMQHISVKVQHTEVSLHGFVSSYFQKQVAQELVKRIPHITTLKNEIIVASR